MNYLENGTLSIIDKFYRFHFLSGQSQKAGCFSFSDILMDPLL